MYGQQGVMYMSIDITLSFLEPIYFLFGIQNHRVQLLYPIAWRTLSLAANLAL